MLAKALMTSVICPDTLSLESCNFTLNIFQDLIFTCFEQEKQCLYATIDFSNFWGRKQGRKSPLNVVVTNM